MGFLGRHLGREAESRGHVVIAVGSPAAGSLGAELMDPAAVTAIFKSVSCDAVIHLAARTQAPGSGWPRDVVEANTGPALNVLNAVADHRPRARVVLVSSSAVYAPRSAEDGPIVESAELRPVLPYGRAKVAVEKAGQASRARGLDVVIARPFNLAGPGQPETAVPASFARQLAAKGADRIVSKGSLSSFRDFTDVRDAARALVDLAEQPTDLGPFNICSGVARRISDVVNDLQRLAGTNLPLHVEAQVTGKVDVPYQCGSRAHIGDAVGWQPTISWEGTLEATLAEWIARNGEGHL